MESKRSARILVVDDEVTARLSLTEVLRLEGYNVEMAESGDSLTPDHCAGRIVERAFTAYVFHRRAVAISQLSGYLIPPRYGIIGSVIIENCQVR